MAELTAFEGSRALYYAAAPDDAHRRGSISGNEGRHGVDCGNVRASINVSVGKLMRYLQFQVLHHITAIYYARLLKFLVCKPFNIHRTEYVENARYNRTRLQR